MKIAYALILLSLSSFSAAQVIGTTKKISATSFCVKYKCQYIKVDYFEEYENWTYYISPSLNFDIFRANTYSKNVAYLITARILGPTVKQSDLSTVAELTKTGIGVNVPAEYLKKCGTAKSEITLYRSSGVEGYDFVRCKRIDSTEIQIVMGNYGP